MLSSVPSLCLKEMVVRCRLFSSPKCLVLRVHASNATKYIWACVRRCCGPIFGHIQSPAPSTPAMHSSQANLLTVW